MLNIHTTTSFRPPPVLSSPASPAPHRLYEMLDHVRDFAIFTLDEAGRIDEWNPSLMRLGGWQPDDAIGRGLDLLMPDALTDATAELMLERARRLESTGIEGWCQRRDGTHLWLDMAVNAMRDPGGRLKGYVVLVRDVSERRKTEEELRLLTLSDPLTGAGNRRSGEDALAAALESADHMGRSASALLLDIDNFKSINDEHGHAGGDQALKAVVEVCRAVCRKDDTVARWGGDEILVVLPGVGRRVAQDIAARVRHAVEALCLDAGRGTLKITTSIGVASATGGCAASLLRCADSALYRAKHAGRNCVAAD